MCFPVRTFIKASCLPRKVSQTDRRSDILGPFPYNQHLHRFDGGTNTWKPLQLETLRQPQAKPLSKFQILSWNIEFSSPFIPERTTAILDYLQNHSQISSAQNDGIPTIILLQEVHVTALPSILSHAYLQAHYDLTDISIEHFRAPYGTITLVPRSLTPSTTAVVRIPFQNSMMGRDVLIVDLELLQPPQRSPSPKINSRIRIGNTHLESARGHADIARPQQLDLISQYISSADGGLVAGDMNAITPIDDEGPRKAGLIDCWEAIHPDDEGYTWGYQPPSEVYPCGRLDKALVSGILSPVSIERVGMGEQLAHPLNSVWLSDHYGLLAQFDIS
jgi:tyrosyl-DNA phosphodiesterase 2